VHVLGSLDRKSLMTVDAGRFRDISCRDSQICGAIPEVVVASMMQCLISSVHDILAWHVMIRLDLPHGSAKPAPYSASLTNPKGYSTRNRHALAPPSHQMSQHVKRMIGQWRAHHVLLGLTLTTKTISPVLPMTIHHSNSPSSFLFVLLSYSESWPSVL
jgi:hypothetical protein